jgi:hypothetical protein
MCLTQQPHLNRSHKEVVGFLGNTPPVRQRPAPHRIGGHGDKGEKSGLRVTD